MTNGLKFKTRETAKTTITRGVANNFERGANVVNFRQMGVALRLFTYLKFFLSFPLSDKMQEYLAEVKFGLCVTRPDQYTTFLSEALELHFSLLVLVEF